MTVLDDILEGVRADLADRQSRTTLAELKALASQLGLHLCCDCISSIGALPVDLRGVYLGTTASGKGLGSYPGLSMVFHDYQPRPADDRLPGYLDLGHWATHQSVPHTHSSNLVFALAEAVRRATPERMAQIAENAAWLRRELRTRGFALVAPEAVASPADAAAGGTPLDPSGGKPPK